MFQNWESELPPELEGKLSLLLQQRRKLEDDQVEIQRQPLMKRHQRALLERNQSFSSSVGKLLDREKENVLNALDQGLVAKASPARGFRNLSASRISFQDSVNNKVNKTFRSVSTAITQNTVQQSPNKYVSNQSVKCFSVHSNMEALNQEQLIVQLTLKVDEQQREITRLKSIDMEQLQRTVMGKIQQQKTNYELLLTAKDDEISRLRMQTSKPSDQITQLQQHNTLLKQQLQELHHQKQLQETQMNKFRDGLLAKLSKYSLMLDQFNERELMIQEMERENVRLRHARDELQLQLARR